jgi:hypothetical protein
MPLATKVLFTLDEANRALPLVRAIAADLVAEFRALRTAGRERRALEAEGLGEKGERRAAALAEVVHAASERVEGYLRELTALGLEIRDLELGLVDFPTLMGSEPAFLCWRLGEPTVAFWHSADKAHGERIPIAAAIATA